MKQILGKQSKETRCYLMAARLYFEGFKPIDSMTEISIEMMLDVLGLTKEDMERFPIPEYPQLLAHLKPISDYEIRNWIITNIYSTILKSRRKDAENAFYNFCTDLQWDAKEIKDSMNLAEEMCELKPINNWYKSSGPNINRTNNSGSGCLSIMLLIIVSTFLLTII